MISLAFAVAFALFILVILLVSLRIHAILPEDQPSFVTEISQASRIVEITTPARSHVLFILGSGGHTTEMLSLIQDIPLETATHRTFVFSSGDTHSAQKAQSFEESHFGTRNSLTKEGRGTGAVGYRLIEIPRARRVRQSLLTTPWTCLLCLRKCLDVVSGGDMAAMPKDERESWKGMEFPDVVVCNGPATAVMLVLACYIFKFFGKCHTRVIYAESFARVTSLSLSGKLLLPLAHRFLVQWPQLADKYPRAEHLGFLVS